MAPCPLLPVWRWCWSRQASSCSGRGDHQLPRPPGSTAAISSRGPPALPRPSAPVAPQLYCGHRLPRPPGSTAAIGSRSPPALLRPSAPKVPLLLQPPVLPFPLPPATGLRAQQGDYFKSAYFHRSWVQVNLLSGHGEQETDWCGAVQKPAELS